MTTAVKSPLSAQQVLEIRNLAGTRTDTELARTFGVSRKTIYNIRTGQRWGSLPNPKSVKGYSNYTVYPDGQVLSKSSGRFLKPVNRATGPVVKLTNNKGERNTVEVRKIVSQAFGKGFTV